LRSSRSPWPRDLRRRSAAARMRRSWVRIPPRAWMSVVGVVCCQKSLRRADHSFRGVLPTVVCCVGSRNLVNEAMARVGPQRHNKLLRINPLNPELNPICYLLALLAHHFLHVSRIRVKSLTIRPLMSYIYIYIWSTYS